MLPASLMARVGSRKGCLDMTRERQGDAGGKEDGREGYGYGCVCVCVCARALNLEEGAGVPGLGEGSRHSRRRRWTVRSVVSLGLQMFCGSRTHWFSRQNP